MKPDEIAKALREAPNYNAGTGTGTIEDDAADLIESQAAENAAYRAENERLAADLKDMRDQNQTISEKNRELCIKLDEREKNSKATQKAMLDEIAKLRNDLTAKTALLDAAIAGQETLQRAFAESQRRERAAISDIMCRDHCDVCKHSHAGVEDCEKYDFECGVCKSEKCVCRNCRDENKWEWRGEAGKGE